jgi:RNA polymerase primary sigma factor
VAIARQYQGKGLSMDDLVSEGNIGLLKAAAKFDGKRGLRFVNYAVVFIRRQIEKALLSESNERRVESNADGQIRSVDAALKTKNNMSLLSVLVNENAPFADERIYRSNMETAAQRALDSLSIRERKVIDAFFGIEQEHLTMAEIGDVMGLKRERVRQIRDRAVRKLRKAYKAAMSR